ncbi:LOW QUALITY PROTEIN: uncharacterized protein WCC33_002845 [Rhinophrynus dorsalis]
MTGPFDSSPIEGLVVSPVGVVPKKEAGKFRLIQHLSYPEGSVNDALEKEVCSVQYQSFDEALDIVKGVGPGAMLAKVDIESAFRLLPLHPHHFKYIGCCVKGKFYVDKCLPMGCAASCAYFEAFSSFIHWALVRRTNVGTVAHYLDDFLLIGKPGSGMCEGLLKELLALLGKLGVPVAEDKTVWLCTRLSFLGIEIDTKEEKCRLPVDKVVKARQLERQAKEAKKLELCKVQELLGVLNFACRVIPMGRVFNRRLEKSTAGVTKSHFKIRMMRQLKADLEVWDRFLQDFNGVCLWRGPEQSNKELQLFTDAAGAVGFGAYFEGSWYAQQWPEHWAQSGLTRNMVFLELFPIVVALELWWQKLKNRAVRFWSDNMSVVHAVNNLLSGSLPVIRLLRILVLICMRHNIQFRALHVPGVDNRIADALSRGQMGRFFTLASGAERTSFNFPSEFWQLGEEC